MLLGKYNKIIINVSSYNLFKVEKKIWRRAQDRFSGVKRYITIISHLEVSNNQLSLS